MKTMFCVREYPFLYLEPQSGFRIAFNMFDTDGNQQVDRKEFLVVSHVISYLLYNVHCADSRKKQLK